MRWSFEPHHYAALCAPLPLPRKIPPDGEQLIQIRLLARIHMQVVIIGGRPSLPPRRFLERVDGFVRRRNRRGQGNPTLPAPQRLLDWIGPEPQVNSTTGSESIKKSQARAYIAFESRS
jgi:hypothetical protein